MRTYIRNNFPKFWHTLSILKRHFNRSLDRISGFLSDISLNIHFFFRQGKGFSSVPCLVPFMRLEFHESGHVTACCYDFTKVKSVGDMNNQTIEQIWNGKEMQRFRKHLYLGKTRDVCMSNCGYLKIGPISANHIKTDNREGSILYDDITNGRVVLKSHPNRFNLSNSYVCNLKCVMCPPSQTTAKSVPAHVNKTEENLKHYFDKRITIYLTGNGDVLARKDTRELLKNFDAKKYSKVSFQILTNGLLFQPDMWKKIKHNNFTYANISIDAATKETYEYIRRGGKWEKLLKALDVFKKAKDDGKFDSVNINMTIMRSNFKEIPQFIKIARDRGFNFLFTRIRGQWGDENFFDNGNDGAIQELKKVLSDKSLYGKDADMNELSQYVPKEFRQLMGNHLTSIWYPSHILKPHNNN